MGGIGWDASDDGREDGGPAADWYLAAAAAVLWVASGGREAPKRGPVKGHEGGDMGHG